MTDGLGKIITFYSYKGGVGRSMALANVALSLAIGGKKVLIIDFDLEAPGIEKFFQNDFVLSTATRKETNGIIDLIYAFKNKERFNWKDNLIQVTCPKFSSELSVLTSGRDDDQYVSRVQTLDWVELFKDHDLGTYFEQLRNEWISNYDYILIDSRTGVSDIGGICTIHLPDIITFVFTTNETSLNGCIDIMNKVKEKRQQLAYDRSAILTIPLPSRDESSTEHNSAHLWKEIFAERLYKFYYDWLPKDQDVRSIIEILTIQYIPFWSFGDRIPVIEEGTSDPKSIGYSYAKIASLILNEFDWYKVINSPSTARRPVDYFNRSTVRIYLSSTTIDLTEHRQKVSDALVRLDTLPVALESFGAIPNSPVATCKRKVLESNALVVIIGHRYGWVPTIEEGGDGNKSITWIEVDTALENNIPVFAFIVEKGFGLSSSSEDEQLFFAKDEEEALAVYRKVKALEEFKAFLDTKTGLTRANFTTPENLALNVTKSLANWSLIYAPLENKLVPKAPEFVFRVVHPLQPAPHFRGRKKILKELKKWWEEPVTFDRVRSLVGMGGSGKTAVAERFIEGIKNEELKGSVLVWSFYDDPNTDAFFKEACIVFAGQEPNETTGKLEYLQRALSIQNNQNLIVLDGLERIQADGRGNSNLAKGDIEDYRLKNLLRSIAAGLGNTRALITSRFQLNDLSQWEGTGYKNYALELLDKKTSIEVLKAWKVRGNNDELIALASSVGYHALSISVLGSYLNHFYSGNIEGAKKFILADAASDEPLAAKLGRILEEYAKNLTEQERDFIVRLSVFPNGISVDIFAYLIDAGGEIAGALFNVDEAKLLVIAERLKQQGLIYSYKKGSTIIYTSHPFLRDYFRNLLNIRTEVIYEITRNQLAIELDTKYSNKPTDVLALNKYEKLIELTILSGRYEEAFNLYRNVMGGGIGENHLYHILSEYDRTLRIMSLFSQNGTPRTLSNQLSIKNKIGLLDIWGYAAVSLGDLNTASLCFNTHIEIIEKLTDKSGLVLGIQNKAWLALLNGLFPMAKKLSEASLNLINHEDKHDKNLEPFAMSFLAYANHCLGDISLAKDCFLKATELNGTPLSRWVGLCEVEHLLKLGDLDKALYRANENLAISEEQSWIRDIALGHYLVGITVLHKSSSEAQSHLQKLRDWTEKSGHMECIIRSHILAGEIFYYQKNYPAAISESRTGLNHAEGSGFGQLAIELLLLLSKSNAAIEDYRSSLEFARKSLNKSNNSDCNYAWGEADGLHLSGVSHIGLGEYELARKRLTEALKIREKIEHPGKEDTRKILTALPNMK